jgi:hypothetical protein
MAIRFCSGGQETSQVFEWRADLRDAGKNRWCQLSQAAVSILTIGAARSWGFRLLQALRCAVSFDEDSLHRLNAWTLNETVRTRPNRIREVNAAHAKSSPLLYTISDRCIPDGECR